MTDLDEQGRPEPPLAAGETATLLGFLDHQRATLAWKCSGLGATVAASSMTLGGLLKHLAYVEDLWCSRWLHGQERQPPWDTVDWQTDPRRTSVAWRRLRSRAAGPDVAAGVRRGKPWGATCWCSRAAASRTRRTSRTR